MKTILIVLLLSKSVFCLSQVVFENQLVKLEIVTESKADSLLFELRLVNKSNENFFIPIQEPLHARIWKSKGLNDVIQLELGYDLKMIKESDSKFSCVKSGQTVILRSGLPTQELRKNFRVKFNANLLLSKSESFVKKKSKYEWFTLDFKLE